MLCYVFVCCCMLLYVIVCNGTIWYGMIWYDMVWYGMTWNNIERHGTLLLLLLAVVPCRHRDCNCHLQVRFSIWMRFKLMNQLVDQFFACIVFLLNCGVWEAYHPYSNRNRFLRACKKRRRIVFRPYLKYPFVLRAKPISVHFFAVIEEIRVFCYAALLLN